MLKNERGSVTIISFVVMLFISLYGAIILGTSARKYSVQTNNIDTIIRAYHYQGLDEYQELTEQELIRIYDNIGGEKLDL